MLTYAFMGHIDNSSTIHHIIIHNVTTEMHGKYKCSIRTDLGTDEYEQSVVVITQPACRLGDWRIRTDPSQCRETLVLDCRNMFPKPAPSCGLWNGKLEKTIMGLSVDISEEAEPSSSTNGVAPVKSYSSRRPRTYRVRYVQQFDLLRRPPPSSVSALVDATNADNKISTTNSSGSSLLRAMKNNRPISPAYLLQFAGHLWFKCDIVVPETSWRLSLVHKIFDYPDACLQDPLEAVAKWRLNYSQYAASQMQQAGYLPVRNKHQQMDDFELLTSNLKYELLAGAGSKQIELNCWRKPKLGTLAKLSCVQPKVQVQHLSEFQAPARLKGASLLQCGEYGWFPVKGSNIDSNGKIQQQDSRPRKILKQRSSSNSTATTATLRNDGGAGIALLEGKIPQKNGSSKERQQQQQQQPVVTYIQAIDSNDLDNDSNEDQELDHTPPTATATTTTTTATATTTIDDSGDQSLDIIPAFDAFDEDGAASGTGGGHITPPRSPQAADPLLSMPASEMAGLLPTCVSPKPARHPHQQISSRPLSSDNRLPLRDSRPPPGNHLSVLESSAKPVSNGQKPETADESGFGLASIFNFSSSSSAAAAGCCCCYRYCVCPTLCCCLIAALLFTTVTTTSHHRVEQNS